MPAADYTLRPLTAGDEPVLWIMLYLALHTPAGQPPPPLNVIFRPELARYARGWGWPGDLGLAAWDADNLPLGAAWLRLLTGDRRGYGWVSDQVPELSVAVLPEHRGQGLGERLIRGVLEAAAGRYPGVSLSVSEGNPAARLYRRLGFREVGRAGGSLTMQIDL